jgi:hypothetical protein
MNFPFETSKATVVWYKDLQEFIEKYYWVEVNIPEVLDCYNDSFRHIVAKRLSGAELAAIEKSIDKWLAGEPSSFNLDYIFYDLVAKEIIPEGKYIVTIYW